MGSVNGYELLGTTHPEKAEKAVHGARCAFNSTFKIGPLLLPYRLQFLSSCITRRLYPYPVAAKKNKSETYIHAILSVTSVCGPTIDVNLHDPG